MKAEASINPQIHTAIQQPGFKRIKRGFRTLKSPAAISNYAPAELSQEVENLDKLPTDPYFPLQWYLRNTGQNGGKVRLDLNVQAAWDQGITGKNVTTAIMDDGTAKALNLSLLIKSIPAQAETFLPHPRNFSPLLSLLLNVYLLFSASPLSSPHQEWIICIPISNTIT
jgi:hypothetical protein